jgi:hypothetical protein
MASEIASLNHFFYLIPAVFCTFPGEVMIFFTNNDIILLPNEAQYYIHGVHGHDW